MYTRVPNTLMQQAVTSMSCNSSKFILPSPPLLPFLQIFIDQRYEEMTIEEILLGKDDYYPGLIPLVYAYLEVRVCVWLYHNLMMCFLSVISNVLL